MGPAFQKLLGREERIGTDASYLLLDGLEELEGHTEAGVGAVGQLGVEADRAVGTAPLYATR
jgi:hypothetical protein